MWRELCGCTFSDARYRAGPLIDGNAVDRHIENELKHQLSATIGRAVAAVSNAGYLELGVALLARSRAAVLCACNVRAELTRDRAERRIWRLGAVTRGRRHVRRR